MNSQFKNVVGVNTHPSADPGPMLLPLKNLSLIHTGSVNMLLL